MSAIATSSSWDPVDLTAALAGRGVSPPDVLMRSDGVGLIYRGRVTWLQGESESLKSMLAKVAVVQVVQSGGRALYIDHEDDEHGVVERLRALGMTPDQIVGSQFTYVRPDEPLMASNGAYTPGMVSLEATLATGYDLAVVDGVTEAMTTEDMDLISNRDIARWIGLVPRRIAETGPAVVVIDHVTKSKEGRGRYALGGGHKLAGVSGCTFEVICTRPLSRAKSDPVSGRSTIKVHKDRPGWVRRHADSDQVVAVLDMTAYPDGGLVAHLMPPDQSTTEPDPKLIENILSYVKLYEGAAKSAIEGTLGGNAGAIRGATAWLVEGEYLEVRKEGVAHRHYITDKGRERLAVDEDEVAA